MNNRHPKVLVLSINPFSKTNSNGRTLGNFFAKWPRENLAQFFVRAEEPDFLVCNRFYCISDKMALRSLIFREKRNGIIKNLGTKEKEDILRKGDFSYSRKIKKTPSSMIIRNFIWNTFRWRNEYFNNWVNEFQPDVILLQAGDFPFLFDFATKLSMEKDIPLVVYNSEDYYFKEYCYFKDALHSCLYPLFRHILRKDVQKCLKRASGCIYITDELREQYSLEFGNDSITLMTISDLVARENSHKNNGFVISYLGNFGVGRASVLCELADVLNEIDTNIKLNLYGNIMDQKVNDKFTANKSINYGGMLSYDEVIDVMYQSDLLIHVENFDPYYIKYIKHGFSTKIADSLASGVPFLVYGPPELDCVSYLKKNEAAHVVSDKDNLYRVLKKIINDEAFRFKYREQAINLAEVNHSNKSNSEKFTDFIKNI